MKKKLAIKGHLTRGNEVIEILEMLGGNDDGTWWGNDVRSAYFINDCTQKIDVCTVETDIVVFTLEEFLKEFPFMVGDKVVDCYGNTVTIKSMSWHDGFETMVYDFKETEDVFCAEDLELYKETIMNENKIGTANELPTFEPMFKMNDEIEYKIPDGYEITEVSKDKVFIKPIKPKYPKTYEDCCKVLGISCRALLSYTYPEVEHNNVYLTKEKHLLDSFMKLRICRNAYWKIAGEEMGLGKPWGPKSTEMSHAIVCRYDGDFLLHRRTRAILIFPTEEMRDAFYENFKNLIEQCKELL